MPTYTVFTWDHEAQRWDETSFAGLTLWQLRGAIRGLRAQGWSNASVLIEADRWEDRDR